MFYFLENGEQIQINFNQCQEISINFNQLCSEKNVFFLIIFEMLLSAGGAELLLMSSLVANLAVRPSDSSVTFSKGTIGKPRIWLPCCQTQDTQGYMMNDCDTLENH